ncbi:MAG: nucleotide sugar dehydrogenase [Chloroflexi bacterium]|nr:nucleotide sugar dehydrogenase [Chloroflexota bacterium]
MLSQLKQKIERKEAVIGVIGLGYVGLPVAAVFAQTGFQVIGVDIKAERVNLINQGVCPIEGEEPGLADLLAEVAGAGKLQATTDYQDLSQADVILIDVETPVDDNHQPQYVALKAACRALGAVLREGALVIVESTIAPGTMDRVVGPLLAEANGRGINEGFYLGACPERVMPGKLLANLRQMSRVCGGSTPEIAELMVALYRHIVAADLDVADCVTAELVKTTENAFRDVNIAFANEVALICEAVGGDVWRVRELVNKSPGRNMHFPGAGVGGHCIPKDPWLLAYGAQGQLDLSLIPAARRVNNQMPLHMVDLLQSALETQGIALSQARVAVLGYAYLENSDDTRNTPSAVLVERLRAAGAEVRIHDPWVAEYEGDLLDCVRGCDAAVLMVAHTAYKTVDLIEIGAIMRTPVLIDGRHLFSLSQVNAGNFVYRVIGRGS